MRTLPSEILLDFNLDDKTLLADSLSELAGRRVNVQTKPRGDRARYLKLARTNAATALTTKLSQQSTVNQRLTALATLLLPEVKRMECFDISHTMGEQTVASCVVFDANGPLRAEYRRYNITGITPGDDYAAMNQVLRRRYGKAIEESKIPDVILIDGGKGQLGRRKRYLNRLMSAGIKPSAAAGCGKRPIVRPVWRHCSSSRKVRASACRRTPGAARHPAYSR
jgi:excinuclease ABC subunit C